ncbi:hypothetical protein VZT92_026722 [Zoarces viviparus]|uniref:Uncharacterized protein n=1 Tax=Zoarces viviparus TaxID=48416 RepID=A0AAW1DTZ9_ZOAVI
MKPAGSLGPRYRTELAHRLVASVLLSQKKRTAELFEASLCAGLRADRPSTGPGERTAYQCCHDRQSSNVMRPTTPTTPCAHNSTAFATSEDHRKPCSPETPVMGQCLQDNSCSL